MTQLKTLPSLLPIISFIRYHLLFLSSFQNSETFSFPILRPCKLQHEFNIWLSINTIEKAPLPHTMHPSHNSTCLLPTPRCVPELQASSLHKDAKFEAFIFIYKVSVWVSPPHHHIVRHQTSWVQIIFILNQENLVLLNPN